MLTDEDKRWIGEQLEGVETRLLTAFHKWASSLEMCLRTHTAALRAMDEETEARQDRIKKLEGEHPAQ